MNRVANHRFSPIQATRDIEGRQPAELDATIARCIATHRSNGNSTYWEIFTQNFGTHVSPMRTRVLKYKQVIISFTFFLHNYNNKPTSKACLEVNGVG